MNIPNLNIGICACGEWEGEPQTHTKCPECGRTWLTLDEVAVRLSLFNSIQETVHAGDLIIKNLSSKRGGK